MKGLEMKKIIATSAVVAALATAAPAQAADFYVRGLLGGTPGFGTMTGPQGEKCKTGWGGSCKGLSYNNLTAESAEKAIAKAVAEHGKSGNTFWVYSLGSNGAILYLNKNPDDQNTWIMVGSPSKPDNGNTQWNYIPLENATANVTFVTKQGDSVSQPNAKRKSFLTHMFGYRELDARYPASSYTVEGTNTKDNVYGEIPVESRIATTEFVDEARKTARSDRRENQRADDEYSESNQRRSERRATDVDTDDREDNAAKRSDRSEKQSKVHSGRNRSDDRRSSERN